MDIYTKKTVQFKLYTKPLLGSTYALQCFWSGSPASFAQIMLSGDSQVSNVPSADSCTSMKNLTTR